MLADDYGLNAEDLTIFEPPAALTFRHYPICTARQTGFLSIIGAGRSGTRSGAWKCYFEENPMPIAAREMT